MTATRQLIVATAIRLFEGTGYAGTTMRGIATEAGVAPSNACCRFASKDQLVQESYLRDSAGPPPQACGQRFPSGGLALLALRVALPRWELDTAEPSCHGNAVAARVRRRWRTLCVPMN